MFFFRPPLTDTPAPPPIRFCEDGPPGKFNVQPPCRHDFPNFLPFLPGRLSSIWFPRPPKIKIFYPTDLLTPYLALSFSSASLC